MKKFIKLTSAEGYGDVYINIDHIECIHESDDMFNSGTVVRTTSTKHVYQETREEILELIHKKGGK